MPDDKRTSKIKTLIDDQTVEQFFNALQQGHEAEVANYQKLLKQTADKYAKEQKFAQEKIVEDIARLENQLKLAGITETEEYRKRLLKENAELDKKRRLEIENSIYKKQVELSTKSGKEKHKQELMQQKEINQAWIKQYEQLEREGKITEDQKKDLEVKRQEVAEAKRYEREKNLTEALKQLSSVINNGMDTYVKVQSGFNARIQGTTSITSSERARFGANIFGALEERMSSAVGVQPYIKTEAMLTNLSDLVSMGIASNVEQRAFLNTVKDNIATTFDVANSSLLRIVRLQQQDSTAARLGMEAYLTRFLNSLVENTEYLNATFDNVSDALLEASSQMSMQASTEFEYVVQKWLGSLTGTGLSENTAQSIAQAIGYLGSGNISALNSSSMQNLLVMAASRAGLDYSSLLTSGLTAQTTNQLMRSLADYMVEIGSNTNNVVRSQLAKTFGLSISDLTAAKQLSGDFAKISNTSLDFLGMYSELSSQMNQMPGRMSMATLLQNVSDNAIFGLATNIAQNPALTALWKITDMISGAGGINIPSIFALGSGVNMNTTLENIMRGSIVGISSLGMIGDIISGIGNTFSPSGMLGRLGITSGNTTITRGGGINSLISGLTTSMSALVGNASGADVGGSVLAAEQSKYQTQVDEAAAEQQKDENNPTNKIVKYLTETLEEHMDTIDVNIRDIKDKVMMYGG